MIKKLLHLLIKSHLLFILFCSTVISQENYFRFIIQSEDEFEFYINDKFTFRGNYYDTTLKSGIYKVEAFQKKSSPEIYLYKRFIELNSDTTIVLNEVYPFLIKTRPSNAMVFMDTVFFGYSPLRLNLLFLPRSIAFKLNGIEKNLDISTLNNFEIDVDLNQPSLHKKKFKGYKYIALGSTIFNGLLSTYFKQKADKYYYKPNRTSDDLKFVKKYDNYSAAFTIAMELSFGIFVYLLFNE